MHSADFDTVIVGGGTAGLAAALWLGRYRRRVLIFDTGQARNRITTAVHGYPGIAEPTPAELRELMLEQAKAAGAQHVHGRVTAASGAKDAFHVESETGEVVAARRLLLCYGCSSRIPAIPGLDEAHGISAFHCPDCDGPSVANARVAVLGNDLPAARLALALLTWTDQLVLLTNGDPLALDEKASATLDRYGIRAATDEIERFSAPGGRIEAVRAKNGSEIPLDAVFFLDSGRASSDLAHRLGCSTDGAGRPRVDASLRTTVPGVYAAGDLARRPYLAISAAADGVRAALTIHRSLLPRDQLL